MIGLSTELITKGKLATVRDSSADVSLEKSDGGDGEKTKNKFMQGNMPRKKIRAKKKGKKKKFMQKEGPIVIFI